MAVGVEPPLQIGDARLKIVISPAMRRVLPCSKLRNVGKAYRFWRRGLTVVGMNTILSAVASVLSFRFRRRASLELELVALRHQVAVLRRQRPGRLRLFSTDRLLWIWLYRIWPRALNGHGAGQAGDRDPVAPQRFPAVLAVAINIMLDGAAEGELRDP